MPKRRTPLTGSIRYKSKAFAIAKALGLPDDMAKEKADKQYEAWASGRTPYATISKKLRMELLRIPDIKPTIYGAIIAYANWVRKVVYVNETLTLEEAIDEGFSKFGLDKVIPADLVGYIKNLVGEIVSIS